MASNRPASPEELFPLIYGELRKVAQRYLGRERRNHTLQPTALVNEAWLRLLVDHGRHQKRQKRGGGVQNLAIDDLLVAASTGEVPVEDLLTLETALTRLETVDPRAAQVVILKFFSGLSTPEIAEHLSVSQRTVEADWTHAKAWLRRELSGAQ